MTSQFLLQPKSEDHLINGLENAKKHSVLKLGRNKTFDDFNLDLKTSNFVSRLCGNRKPTFWRRPCQHGKYVLDKEGAKAIFQDQCNSPYCKKENCVRYRTNFCKLTLKSYFYAFPTWRNKKQKWLHYVIGTPRVSKEELMTKKYQKKFRGNVNKFLHYFRSQYNKPHMIGVFDLSFDGETYFPHFHLAIRIRGKLDYKKLHEKGSKLNLGFHKANGEYTRTPGQLIKYFSERMVGRFEHEDTSSDWMYADKFTPQEYVRSFLGSKRFITKGFKKADILEIRKKIKEKVIICEANIGSSTTNNGLHINCPECDIHDTKREFLTQEEIIELLKDPDPLNLQIQSQNIAVFEVITPEVIKIQ